jgi:hypothetical protein
VNERRCDNCGRTGTRGFVTLGGHLVNTPVGPEYLPELTACTARNACRERAYRLTPAHIRAARRWSDEAAS